jgi:hypothetical protein
VVEAASPPLPLQLCSELHDGENLVEQKA